MNNSNKDPIRCVPLEHLIHNKITPALFVGAGFSRRYLKDYPDWYNLLLLIADKIKLDRFIIENKYNQEKEAGVSHADACLSITKFLEDNINKQINEGYSSDIFNETELIEIRTKKYNPLKYRRFLF